jgi:hypothetical protein
LEDAVLLEDAAPPEEAALSDEGDAVGSEGGALSEEGALFEDADAAPCEDGAPFEEAALFEEGDAMGFEDSAFEDSASSETARVGSSSFRHAVPEATVVAAMALRNPLRPVRDVICGYFLT